MFQALLNDGRQIAQFIVPLFSLFRDDGFAPLVASLLFLAAVSCCLLFVFKTVLPIRYQLDRSTRALRKMTDGSAFANRLDQFETIIIKTVVGRAWGEFKETLLLPDFERDHPPLIRNTARPQDYLSATEVGLEFRIYRMLPNLFVGLGLLLTFIGLVSALYFATQGIKGADVDTTKSALSDLLTAASFKFYTSVAGLAGSILLSIFIRGGTKAIDAGFDNLCHALEMRMVRVTPEWIAFQQYLEAREQTVCLKRFNDEVAITVGRYVEDAINKSLPEHLRSAMQPLADKFAEVTTNLSRMNEDALRTMAEGFGRTMQGAAGDQMRQLVDVIASMKMSLDGMRQNLDEGGRNLAGALGGSVEQIRQAVDGMEASLAQVSAKIEHSIDRGGEALDRQVLAAAEILEQTSARVLATLDAAAAGAARRVSEEAASVAGALSAAVAAATSDSNAQIKLAAAGFSDAVNSLSGDLKGAISGMTTQLVTTTAELARIDAALERQRSAFVGLSEGAKSAESKMTAAARAMQEASAPLVSATAAIADAVRHTDTAVNGIRTALKSMEERTEATSKQLADTFETMKRVWSNYEDRFKGIDESLETAFKQIVQQVERNTELCNAFLTKLDEGLAKSIQRLAGAIEELSDLVDAVERAAGSFSQKAA